MLFYRYIFYCIYHVIARYFFKFLDKFFLGRAARCIAAPRLGKNVSYGEWAIGGRCQENLCHSETSSQTGRGNPSLFQTAVCFSTALRRTDCHVASLLAMTVEDFTLLYLLRSALGSTLATPFPSVRAGDCLAAARSRRGSDMPPACHSLPRRRFATLAGAALRGKGLVSNNNYSAG